ncbi:MAG: hypothetical protein AB7K09_11345 [Planctomycetota bacterium]
MQRYRLIEVSLSAGPRPSASIGFGTWLALLVVVALVAAGVAVAVLMVMAVQSAPSVPPPFAVEPPAIRDTGSDLLLPEVPAGEAITVRDARACADGSDVIIDGRIRDVPDRVLAFTLIDLSLEYCEDGCRTPWDYCGTSGDEVRENLIGVRFENADGSARLAAPGRLLDWRNLDHVKVVGTIKVQPDGSRVVIARRYWLVERPDLRGLPIQWPPYVARD